MGVRRVELLVSRSNSWFTGNIDGGDFLLGLA